MDTGSPLFEIHHGSAVIRIADDWSGHVLIEQIYTGLRRARQSRDAGREIASAPTPGSAAADAMIEAALALGFRRMDEAGTYRASAAQIVALVAAAREQGRADAQREAASEAGQSAG